MVVIFLEIIDIQHHQRKWPTTATGIGPFALHHHIEHTPVRHFGKTIPIRQLLQFALQSQQCLFILLALADIEHEANQCFHITVTATHHMDHIANPDVITIRSERAIVRFMVNA